MVMPNKLCLSRKVVCGRKGRRPHPVSGGTVIACRNTWGCRYQMDLTNVPEKDRQPRLQLVASH